MRGFFYASVLVILEPMQEILFRSTVGEADAPVPVETAIAEGMPADGGLYVPVSFPRLPDRVFSPEPLSYAELAFLVMKPYFPGWDEAILKEILRKAYDQNAGAGREPYFDTGEVAPLVPLEGIAQSPGARVFVLELFHGRTCAFKDMALSVLGGLIHHSLERLGRREPLAILTATSGDTGSAALEGLAGVPGLKTAVVYPHAGTSEIQRLQMVTTSPENRLVLGLKGNFDDAQSAVKAIFASAAISADFAGIRLSSANSINIGRLLPQIVYYVKAWRDLSVRGALGRDGQMNVAVPTGNFGDILAAKYAKEMGLPIGTLVCASNANKVLADFFATGVYDRCRPLVKTDSPSMDILVSSNLERLVFLAAAQNPERVKILMSNLKTKGIFKLNRKETAYLADFEAGWCSDYSAGSAISKAWSVSRVLLDPHTATALDVVLQKEHLFEDGTPLVIAGTASPYKFPRACSEALGFTHSDSSVSGDLDCALQLEAKTGIAMPRQLKDLSAKTVHHRKVVTKEELAAELAQFFRNKSE